VRDNWAVREEIKRRYRSLLIDEFQDTDPIQYEILLYLAERPGSAAKSWREVRLAPGKIFIVGDPKQSIYAFRRADIEAYLEVVESIVLAQGGAECRLTTNFRSHAAILDAVNGIFASLMRPQQGLQPSYIPIYPAPERDGKTNTDLPRVLVRKVDADGGELDAERARRLEGESLAQWLKEEVLGKAVITNAQGEKALAQPKDVALLFRKLTDIHEYLEPFRRHGIRYVVEGERHFYAAKEIIDAVNLLRAIDNPHDRIALVGVLRSPLGGLTDCQIYQLKQKNLLDYRRAERLDKEPFPATLQELYRTLARLHEETRLLPVGSAVAHIFAFLPINLLAACAFHGEQAVANLEKLRQQAERLGREGLTTLKETIRQLERRVLEVKEEGESVLAEENLDAVRIMSVHKAKGLEFPIVVVAGCQAGSEARQASEAAAHFDWSTGLTGLRCGSILDPVGLYLGEKARLCAEAEQKRVLYVAITRAREHLVISCAPTERRSNGSFLAMLEETLGVDIKAMSQSQTIRVGEGTVVIEPIAQSLTPPGGGRSEAQREQNKNWRPFIDQWAERRRRCESVLEKPLFVTPTSLKRRQEESSEFAAQGAASVGRDLALAVGDLAHAFLEHWDFSADPKHFAARLTRFVDVYLPADLRGERDRILAELGETFQSFFASTIYRELSRASILGREVPLLMPWDGQIMEGVIDLIYERQGLLYLADYKTDRIGPSELSDTASRYRQQVEVYTRAARLGLKREVAGFKLIFLRLGKAVEMIAPNGQRSLFEDENPVS
jgi:ATP-dependent helicase/nuclease subunit A